jgi:hypothetical protein
MRYKNLLAEEVGALRSLKEQLMLDREAELDQTKRAELLRTWAKTIQAIDDITRELNRKGIDQLG